MRFYELAIILVCAAMASLAVAQTPTLSLEETIALKRVSAIEMSPDGNTIAYLQTVPRSPYEDDDGVAYRELHLVDSAGRQRGYVTGKVEVLSLAWSADGSSIFYVAMRDEDKFPALYEIPLAGGESSKRFDHVNAIAGIYPAPDGKRLAFLAADAPPEKIEELAEKGFRALVYEESVQETRVWMLDLESGGATALDLPGSASGFAWSPDGKRLVAALAPTPLVDDALIGRDLYIIDSKSGKNTSRIGAVGKLGHFAWSPTGEHIAYVGAADINDPSEGRLYLSSVAGGERRELLPDYRGHVRDVSWTDADSVRFLGLRRLGSEIGAVSIFDPQTPSSALGDGPIFRSFKARPGVKAVVAIADSPQHPPEVYLLRDGAQPKRLTNSNPWLDERQLGRQEAITYKARDGLELDAVLIRPVAQSRRAPKPLIVFVHGGPESHYSNGWMSSYSQPAHALAAAGYSIVYPNYRGSTGRGVEFSKRGQHDYAEEEFNDIVDAKNALIARGFVDADRVGISGGSYGGYASMWAASALTEHFTAAVAFVGISNQLSKFGTGDIPREMYNVHSRAWPWEDWMWMLRRSPVFHADKTQTALLILAGDKDPRVHPSQSLEMYRHVKLRSDAPVRLVFYPDEVHGNKKTAAQYDYALRLERWMNHYLLGDGGLPPAWQIDHAKKLEAVLDSASE